MKKLFYLVMATLMVMGAVSCRKDNPGQNYKSVTVAEFLAAPESETQVYELVGTISGSAINTTYGNFDLTDDTGTVYIYGLTATNLGYGIKNDKSFSSLGLDFNDRIRIRGYRGAFEDRIEMLSAWFIEKLADSGNDTPTGNTVSVETNSVAEIWTSSIDNTYGSGFATTVQGLLLGYFKHTSTTNPVSPNENHVRINKNNVFSIRSTDGKKFKKIVIGCAPDAGDTSYCYDMTGLEGGPGALANNSAKTVTWTGSAARVILQANLGQVRVEKLTVEFE